MQLIKLGFVLCAHGCILGSAVNAAQDLPEEVIREMRTDDAPTLHYLERPEHKNLVDYFLPVKPRGELVDEGVWGVDAVLPRDIKNGLEDPEMKTWCYWDGMIIRSDDGKYRMYGSMWDQKHFHGTGWKKHSKAMQAWSDHPAGPYRDVEMCWPHWNEGMGCNVFGLRMHDGRYALVTSEITPGTIFVSDNPEGPWEYHGEITWDANGFHPGMAAMQGGKGRMSNVSILLRPDGRYMIVPRSCCIMISDNGILGPYKIVNSSVYSETPGYPQEFNEDPTVWYSGGLYHVVVNHHGGDSAYHFVSENGIDNWRYRGLAFVNDAPIPYEDGTLNKWWIRQRPMPYLEDGHVKYFSFSVLDVHKGSDAGNDNHGSKIIVVPFDGEAFDRDMNAILKEEKAAEARAAKEPENETEDYNFLSSHYYSFEPVHNQVGAGWKMQGSYSVTTNKASSGRYALKCEGRGSAATENYFDFSRVRPQFPAGRIPLSARVWLDEESPKQLGIRFSDEEQEEMAVFNLSELPRGEWVTVETSIVFGQNFNSAQAVATIGASSGDGVVYVDEIRADMPILGLNVAALDSQYYGFELESDDAVSMPGRWLVLEKEDPHFSIVKASDENEVQPFSGNACITFHTDKSHKWGPAWKLVSDYGSSGSPDSLVMLKPAKYRVEFQINIVSDSLSRLEIGYFKDGIERRVKAPVHKVDARNEWQSISVDIDLSDMEKPEPARLNLRFPSKSGTATFYVDDVKMTLLK